MREKEDTKMEENIKENSVNIILKTANSAWLLTSF